MVGPDRARTEAAGAEEHDRTRASGVEVQKPGGGRSRAVLVPAGGSQPGMRL